jgi:hypothetical protein
VIRLGCETVSCLMLRYRNKPQLFFKCAVGVANISSCLLFLYTLRKYSTAAKQIRNRSVVITIVFETLLNIVPAFFCLGFSFVCRQSNSLHLSITDYDYLILLNKSFPSQNSLARLPSPMWCP